jgi:hypothetical protein
MEQLPHNRSPATTTDSATFYGVVGAASGQPHHRHELVHALQDQYRRSTPSWDSNNGRSSAAQAFSGQANYASITMLRGREVASTRVLSVSQHAGCSPAATS